MWLDLIPSNTKATFPYTQDTRDKTLLEMPPVEPSGFQKSPASKKFLQPTRYTAASTHYVQTPGCPTTCWPFQQSSFILDPQPPPHHQVLGDFNKHSRSTQPTAMKA